MVKKLKWNLILMSLLYVGLGIFLVMKPGTALNIVCYALGGVVLACAAVQLIRYFVVERGVFQSQLTLISGLICLALGVFLLLRSDIVVSILPIVFGLFVIFDAIGRVQNALDLRRCGYDSWKGFLLLPVLSVVLGVILIANPFGAMETLVMAIGVILIVEGAINLLSALYTVLAVRRFAKLHPETQSVLESITGEDLNGDGVVAPDVTRTDAEATAVELDHVDEPLTRWRVHGVNTTFRKFGQFADETLRILDKHRKLYPGYDRDYPDLVGILTRRAAFQKAVTLWREGNGAEARRLVAPYVASPKLRLFWLASWLPGSLFDPLSQLYFKLPGFLRK